MSQGSRRAAILLAALLGASGAGAAVIENATQPWLEVGADGLGIVAYRHQPVGSASSELRVSRCVDAACSAVATATVDPSGDVGYRPSMTIAPDGRPVLSYLDLTNGDLKVAFCADAGCTTANTVVLDPEVAFSDQPEFGRTAVAVGADGFVLVAYTDREPGTPLPPLLFNDRLKVVHCEDAACTTARPRTSWTRWAGGRGPRHRRRGRPGLRHVASRGPVRHLLLLRSLQQPRVHEPRPPAGTRAAGADPAVRVRRSPVAGVPGERPAGVSVQLLPGVDRSLDPGVRPLRGCGLRHFVHGVDGGVGRRDVAQPAGRRRPSALRSRRGGGGRRLRAIAPPVPGRRLRGARGHLHRRAGVPAVPRHRSDRAGHRRLHAGQPRGGPAPRRSGAGFLRGRSLGPRHRGPGERRGPDDGPLHRHPRAPERRSP